MHVPTIVKVLYKEFAVEKQPGLHDGADVLYGRVDGIDQIITLNDDASEEQNQATLIHEMIHAYDDLMSIELKEEQTTKLGTAIYMMVKDNPEMFRP